MRYLLYKFIYRTAKFKNNTVYYWILIFLNKVENPSETALKAFDILYLYRRAICRLGIYTRKCGILNNYNCSISNKNMNFQ